MPGQTFSEVRDSLPYSSWDDPAVAYSGGYVGAWPDPAATERLHDEVMRSGGVWSAEDVAYSVGAVDQGKDRLSLITEAIATVFGSSAMPGPAQAIGDCVAHNLKNAILGTIASAVVAGLQGRPIVSSEAIAQGVFSTEVPYWWRGHSGDGWNCDEALAVSMRHAGAVVRQAYPTVNIDLSRYSSKVAHKFGSIPPDRTTALPFGRNLVTTVTRCRTWEEVRDLIASGHALSSCGSEGFSNVRDDCGVSKREGRWAHAMAGHGADDRVEIRRRYGCGLVLMAQTWGPNWNQGPRRIMGTSRDIPHGYFWARWDDVKNRSWSAVSTVNGWANAKLPEWNLGAIV